MKRAVVSTLTRGQLGSCKFSSALAASAPERNVGPRFPGFMRVHGLGDSWAHVSGPQHWLPAPQRGTWDLGSKVLCEYMD
jgi:hypothetical protein